jgi:hypothetical protein
VRALEARGPVAPPFKFNANDVAKFSPEVTGRIILNSMAERLGWPSLHGKRLLDFGCGVRMAATIYNLEIDVASYTGVDVNAGAIDWLNENVAAADPRFCFERINMLNGMYNPKGERVFADWLHEKGVKGFDAACMFSVITHQAPDDAALIFSMLRPCAERLYFTTFLEEGASDYREGAPNKPLLMSTYSRELLRQLLVETGWTIEAVYPPSDHLFQMTAVVCR